MNGLRVYINPVSASLTTSDNVFYSRRADGPYYRWLFEEKAGQWRGARVIAADFRPHSLSMASWKSVPVTLQTRLGEHYLD
jgi:hypothetical protein